MPAAVQHLLGQLADGRFPLRKLLGVSENSAVFLTTIEAERRGEPAADAAIKLIPEDPSTSDIQLDHWRAAAAVSHPGLLRILQFGRCVIDGAPCLYIVTELADEDLGQLLPRRALTPEETSGMLAAVLPALDFLHENGFVHAGLKPSNIHATGDNVKLSADRIVPAGESASTWPLAAPFAAPESILFPASDIWSLGVSLSETLTKILPEQRPSGRFALPELPAPFSEIVRSALVLDATLRITLDEVRSLLDPSFVAKRKLAPAEPPVATSVVARPPGEASNAATSKAATVDSPATNSPYVRPPEAPDSPESLISTVGGTPHPSRPHPPQRQPLPEVDPLSVPLSPVSPGAGLTPQPSRAAIPVTSLPQVNATIGSPRRVISPNPAPRSNKLFLVSAAAAILLAILFVPRYFLRSRNPSTASSTNSSAPSSSPDHATATARKNPPPSSPNSRAIGTPAPLKEPAAKNSEESSLPAALPDTDSRSDKSNLSSTRKSARSTPSSGNTIPHAAAAAPANVSPLSPTITHKVLPEVSSRARSSIRGTVRINVRMQLNPDGSVSSAELASPASSEFFANLALKAARQWHFAPSTPSAVVRFDFTQSSTTAYLP